MEIKNPSYTIGDIAATSFSWSSFEKVIRNIEQIDGVEDLIFELKKEVSKEKYSGFLPSILTRNFIAQKDYKTSLYSSMNQMYSVRHSICHEFKTTEIHTEDYFMMIIYTSTFLNTLTKKYKISEALSESSHFEQF